MSFGDAVSSAFNNYFNFSGRARRSEYWYFTLFNVLVSSALSCVMNLLGAKESAVTAITGRYSLAVMIPGLALVWRRLHDIGKSGANYFWIFVPLIGFILILIWMCRDGQNGPNRYGPDPKDPGFTDYGGDDRAPWQY